MPLIKHSFIGKLLMIPWRYPAANKSPAPVKSLILRFFWASQSISSLFSIDIAPFSPLVITTFFLICFEKVTVSSKELASINDVISCSFAKMISSLFLANYKKCFLCLSKQNKSDNDIATLFEYVIALSKAFLGSPSSHK